MIKYIAFLRAINVGGKNLIKMDDLKKVFESLGFKNVATYIQSGNVMFESSTTNETTLAKKIENLLHKNLSDNVLVFIRKFEQLKSIVENDPFTKLTFEVPTKLYVTFLKDELKQKPKLPYLSAKKDVKIIQINNREIYCIPLEINGSYGFPNLFIEKEFRIKATTRNWDTIIKVFNLMQ
jgi:uncharacterized protein (DUF1697 family)